MIEERPPDVHLGPLCIHIFTHVHTSHPSAISYAHHTPPIHTITNSYSGKGKRELENQLSLKYHLEKHTELWGHKQSTEASKDSSMMVL